MGTKDFIDLRRYPRCIAKLKAFFPNDDNTYFVTDVSYKGCFIQEKTDIPIKKLVYFEIEIPEIGLIPIYGIVIHHGTKDNPGLGIEIIDIDKDLLPVWASYLKALLYIEDAKQAYRRAILQKQQTQSKKNAKSCQTCKQED